MTTILGRLAGLGFLIIWIALALFIVTYPRDWAEWVTTNAETAGQLIRAVLMAGMIWTGVRSYGKIGVIVDDMAKAWIVWSTKKKKSQ